MAFRIIPLDPEGDEPVLLWDTTFGSLESFDGHGDWAISSPNDRQNPKGLKATAPIETAIALQLMTDARARPEDNLPDWVTDLRGWPGDSFDVDEGAHEQELGSRLWTLQWQPLTEDVRRRAEDIVREALNPLIRQRLVQRLDVRAELLADQNRIDIEVNAYGATGSRPIARRFALLWERHGGVQHPLAR